MTSSFWLKRETRTTIPPQPAVKTADLLFNPQATQHIRERKHGPRSQVQLSLKKGRRNETWNILRGSLRSIHLNPEFSTRSVHSPNAHHACRPLPQTAAVAADCLRAQKPRDLPGVDLIWNALEDVCWPAGLLLLLLLRGLETDCRPGAVTTTRSTAPPASASRLLGHQLHDTLQAAASGA